MRTTTTRRPDERPQGQSGPNGTMFEPRALIPTMDLLVLPTRSLRPGNGLSRGSPDETSKPVPKPGGDESPNNRQKYVDQRKAEPTTST